MHCDSWVGFFFEFCPTRDSSLSNWLVNTPNHKGIESHNSGIEPVSASSCTPTPRKSPNTTSKYSKYREEVMANIVMKSTMMETTSVLKNLSMEKDGVNGFNVLT
ncbi:hypothetical protein L1887_24504 [Cichorium endivia]|nr:hypothetical protein L1887_24504 [Cichorium endivia]